MGFQQRRPATGGAFLCHPTIILKLQVFWVLRNLPIAL
jgi:hypothetical protein